MDSILGLLKLRIKKGISLAVRDTSTSDPYVVVTMGEQKLKTSAVKNSINPEWNEELTLSIQEVNTPIHLTVFDKDTFSVDDKMGDAEIDIKPYLECLKTNQGDLPLPLPLPDGSVVKTIQSDDQNFLSEDSSCIVINGNITQQMTLALKNVERGHIVLQIEWRDVPGCKGLSGVDF